MYRSTMVACVITMVTLMSTKEQMSEATSSQRYCGDSLKNALSLICSGGFNKRSGDDLVETNVLSDDPETVRLFRDRNIARSLRLRQRARGVADECCHRSCSINELSSYCVSPRGSK
ncbi:LIRP-like [Homalodisca vitripennis]|uniref:LIRP-like n=1 Tax=Homalodisca vitripennis TaxID=197043 RepID=UPI001EEC41BA|nr:LIRP-like [Homalodisca vitripennis]